MPSPIHTQQEPWQQALMHVITSVADLLAYLGLKSTDLPINSEYQSDFPLRVPQSFANRMHKQDPNDPLLLQVLPTNAELDVVPGYTAEALREGQYNPCKGLLHKYHGRVLWLVTGACAIHCRYCFRRNFPYEAQLLGRQDWVQALNYIAADTSIHEVILSGGDPLSAKDSYLAELTNAIAVIPHVKILRIHSRMPMVLPERITERFVESLTGTRLQVVMILHCNHPQEINADVQQAIARMRAHNITVLNQTVLLRNINDNAATLRELSLQLFAAGALPYYLHVLDKVAGAAHFDLERIHAKQLHQQLRHSLPGYLVPELVVECPGERSKIVVV